MYGYGLTGSVLLKEAVEQARRVGKNMVKQALREKQFVGSMTGHVRFVIWMLSCWREGGKSIARVLGEE